MNFCVRNSSFINISYWRNTLDLLGYLGICLLGFAFVVCLFLVDFVQEEEGGAQDRG